MVEMGGSDSYTPRPSRMVFGESDASGIAARLSSRRRRRVYEPPTDRVFPAKAVALARRTPCRFDGHLAPPQGRKPVEARFDRPRHAGDRTSHRAAHARSRT